MSKKRTEPISPWVGYAALSSPNGLMTAIVTDAHEVGMGAPKSGTLEISNGFTIDGCNPSMVWSDDSHYLAIPQWTSERKQKLLVISVQKNTLGYAAGEFKVLELFSFIRGKIKGIDSPIFNPKEFEIGLDEIVWATPIREKL